MESIEWPNLVYHGTNLFAAKIIAQYGIWLNVQRRLTDFGKGFYVTHNVTQAMDWANVRAITPQMNKVALKLLGISEKAFFQHPDTRIPALLQFTLNMKQFQQLNGLLFPLPNNPKWREAAEHWNNFVTANRHGSSHSYDFVFGPVSRTHHENPSKFVVYGEKSQLSLHSPLAIQSLSNRFIFPLSLSNHSYSQEANRALPSHYKEIWQIISKKEQQLLDPNFLLTIPKRSILEEPPSYWANAMLASKKNYLWHEQYESLLLRSLPFL